MKTTFRGFKTVQDILDEAALENELPEVTDPSAPPLTEPLAPAGMAAPKQMSPERYEQIRKRLEKTQPMLNPELYRRMGGDEPVPEQSIEDQVREKVPWLKDGMEDLITPMPQLGPQGALNKLTPGTRVAQAQGTPVQTRTIRAVMDPPEPKPAEKPAGKPEKYDSLFANPVTAPAPKPSGAKVFKYEDPKVTQVKKVQTDLETATTALEEAVQRLEMIKEAGGTMEDVAQAEAAFKTAATAYEEAELKMDQAGAQQLDPAQDVLSQVKNPLVRARMAQQLGLELPAEDDGMPDRVPTPKMSAEDMEYAQALRQGKMQRGFSNIGRLADRLAASISGSQPDAQVYERGYQEGERPLKQLKERRDEADKRRRLKIDEDYRKEQLKLRGEELEARKGDLEQREQERVLRQQKMQAEIEKTLAGMTDAEQKRQLEDPSSLVSQQAQQIAMGDAAMRRTYTPEYIKSLPAAEIRKILNDKKMVGPAGPSKQQQKWDRDDEKAAEKEAKRKEEEAKQVVIDGLEFADPSNPPEKKSHQEAVAMKDTYDRLMLELDRWERNFAKNGFERYGTNSDAMNRSRNRIVLILKELEKLGVLTGNDEEIIARTMPPETGGSNMGLWNGIKMSEDRVKTSFKDFRELIDGDFQAAMRNRRYKVAPRGAAAPAPAPKPDVDLEKPAPKPAPSGNRPAPKDLKILKVGDPKAKPIVMEAEKAKKLIAAGLYKEVK